MVERSPGNPLHSVRRIGAPGWLAGCAIGTATAALLAGPGNRIPTQPSAQAAFTSGATAAQIPIEMAGYEIFVPVRVNARQPSSFLLDTGASASAIDPERARKLALESEQTLPGRGLPTGPIPNVRLELPGVHFFLPQLAAIPLDDLGRSLGHPVDGLLGADGLSRFVVEINYARQTLQLYDPRVFHYSGHGAKLRLNLVNGRPRIVAKIDVPGHGGVEGDFLLDTGSDHALLLSEAFMKSHGLLTRHLKMLPSGESGEGRQGKRLLARLAALELGPYRLTQPIALIQEMRSTDERKFGGIIGSEVLRRFTVILDLPDSRLILEPNTTFREPFETDMSGIAFVATGANLSSFEVRSVLPDSPAAQAGVRSGDVLVALDGEPAQSYTLADIRRLLQQEGHTHKLLLRRGKEQIAVELTLRRLL